MGPLTGAAHPMIEDLHRGACAARDASLAVEKGRRARFDLLESLETGDGHSGGRTSAEEKALETLLTAHDLCARSFPGEVEERRTRDLAAYEALIGRLTPLDARPAHDAHRA